jgi:hypothetical protein
MEKLLNEICIDTMTPFEFKGIKYNAGEIEFHSISTETTCLLSSYKNMVIIFNDYFSSNEIKGETFTYENDLCFEIKPIATFWETSINISFYAEFIILPDTFVFDTSTKNTCIELIIKYISDKLKSNYEKDTIDEYITKLSNKELLSCKVDALDFTRPIIFKLDDGTIEQLIFEENSEINQDDIEHEEDEEEHEEYNNEDNTESDYEDIEYDDIEHDNE